MWGSLGTLGAHCLFGSRSTWISTNAIKKQGSPLQNPPKCWLLGHDSLGKTGFQKSDPSPGHAWVPFNHTLLTSDLLPQKLLGAGAGKAVCYCICVKIALELDSRGHVQLDSHLVRITLQNPQHWQDAHPLRETGTKNSGRIQCGPTR